MINILHKGIQATLPLDMSKANYAVGGVLSLSSAVSTTYIQGLIAGRLVCPDAKGFVSLCDGKTSTPLGFLILDAKGGFFENIPGLSGGMVSHTFGNTVIRTDQIVAADTFKVGDKVYAGTGDNVGLATNVAPAAGAHAIGLVGEVPEVGNNMLLKVYVNG
jgi:hypothetical protein